LAAAASSSAAYHYVHYPSRTNFTPIYEKFNLSALPNNTVTIQVADQGPTNFAPNDTFGSVLAQIKSAAAAWNSVVASDLRIAYGGLQAYTPNPTITNPGNPLLNDNTPGIDVIFVDTPGLLGLGAPTSSTIQALDGNNQPYFPIVRGLVMLTRDTSNPNGPGPSYTEEFFTTAVHEIGHALGLQHTWTSSAMSQDIVRNTSRARPVDADDIASLAALYGPSHLQANYGSISGRVTFPGGTGVSLASVVAMSPTGPAVSALTNPDGTYQIVGLPPNYSYLVYAHPLPPDGIPADNSGLRLPVDQNFQPFIPNGSFVTVFNAPGGSVTLDPSRAASYPVGPGSAIGNVNFAVQPRTGVPVYDVWTYSQLNSTSRQYTYTGDAQVVGYPAFIDITKSGWADVIVRAANGTPAMPTPQSMTILGGFAPALLNNPDINGASVVPYSGLAAVVAYFGLPANPGTGPRHLVFNFGNDIYVLPYAVDLVQKGPPKLTAVTPNGDGTVTVTGAGLGSDTRVYFDGMQASQPAFTGNDSQGSIVVTPPQASSGQVSTVTVYNSDGQNSLILATAQYAVSPAVPPTYTYLQASPQLAAISPQAIPAGSSAAVDITTTGTNFVDGQVVVGFGSDDVPVRRVWVLSPTHLIADVVVAPNAATGLSEVSVASGMQVMSQANAFQIQPVIPGAPAIGLPVTNLDSTQPGIYPGSAAAFSGQNLAGFGTQLTLNGQPVAIMSATATRIIFQVPAGTPAGPATLKLSGTTASAPPVLVQIDNPPPVVAAVNTLSNSPAAGTILSPGDTIVLIALGLDPSLAAGYQGRLRVTVAGLEMQVVQLTPMGGGAFQIQVVLTQSFGASAVPLALIVDSSPSQPQTIVVR
jgi:uncharacterized protein (TIGR03437 family)